jgi:LysR family transcriptional regulator, glycine cleavage system transcriptional activator
MRYPLIHFDWFANDPTSPNWKRWFEMASAGDPRARHGCQIALSFREELHAIEAVLAGQGVALCSDVIVADDLASGALVKVFDLALPGYGFYPVYAPGHPCRETIEVFVRWISAVAGAKRSRILAAQISRSKA